MTQKFGAALSHYQARDVIQSVTRRGARAICTGWSGVHGLVIGLYCHRSNLGQVLFHADLNFNEYIGQSPSLAFTILKSKRCNAIHDHDPLA